MEVLRVLSPPPAGRSPRSGVRMTSPAGKSSRSDGQENTPPVHPNLNRPIEIRSLKSDLKSVTTAKCDSVMDFPPFDADSDASVKVVVRVRSVSEKDKIVRKLSDQDLEIGDRTFNFHTVFDPQSTQEDVFKSIGVPLVHNALAGYNTSVVSYGQTGTGKTHTMWGPPSAMVNISSLDAKLGLVPRFFRMLFSEIQKRQEGSKQKQINYQCRCSFFEIYNEQINDLLDPTQRDLQIREDEINGIHVENLSDEYVTSHEDISQILIKGLSNRKVGATSLNSKSSRSHIMFTFILESWCKQPSSSNFSSSKSSRITFVDLAGLDKDEFEQKKKDCTKEERFVKKSLSRLGKLVNILSDGKDQKVSYLGSSLTYLLQDTLGGNSKVTFLCHISSDKRSKAATLSTLRFGERAKHIENKPAINEITEDDVNGLSDQIRQLKEELIRAKSSDKSPSESFRGFNARKNLNLLRVNLNRSLILPSIETDSDSETDLESNEKEITEFCAQISNDCTDSCTALEEISLNSPISEKNNEIEKKSIEEPEPTLCSSPRINIKARKSIVSPKNLGLRVSVSKDEVANVRNSIQSTKLSPTDSLAASLHRGLNIIEENEQNNNINTTELIRKSFVSLSFEHLALKGQSPEKFTADSNAHKSFLCVACKGENENKARDESTKREKELEALCAEQEAKIKHLTQLVELKNIRESVRNSELTKSIQASEKTIDQTETEENLLDKIRNGLSTNQNPQNGLTTDQNSQNGLTTDLSLNDEKWLESESRWICLTEELRQDLESNRRYADQKDAELAKERRNNAELDDALTRAIQSHCKMIEHYADLQEAYSDLLDRHRSITDAISSVKKAAQNAHSKSHSAKSSAFAAALAAELSVARIDREKERAVLKEQNRRLRVQLRDTAEAVHAAGELLVRLREAEEALGRSEEKNGEAQQENQKLKKQMEKLKKKHMLDMATMKNYLAESRLPGSALEPFYRADEYESESESGPTRENNESWRAAFAPAFEE